MPFAATRIGTIRTSVARLLLTIVCVLSIALVTTVNRAAGHLVPSLPWLPDTCLASSLVCVGIYLAVRPARPFGRPPPHVDWRSIIRIGSIWLGLWLLGSAIVGIAVGHWVRYRLANGPAQLVGFLALGPFQEEVLFRGTIFELAERSRLRCGSRIPIMTSAVFFGLHHFQLHQYRFTSAAVSQVGFALAFGVFLGRIRAEARSIWPGLLLHFLTNLPGAFGS